MWSALRIARSAGADRAPTNPPRGTETAVPAWRRRHAKRTTKPLSGGGRVGDGRTSAFALAFVSLMRYAKP